jgi:dTDP-6-deoxy-L-talose 4-dehydrogenase (NAD+)
MTEGLLSEEMAVRPTTAYADAKVRLHDSIRNLAGSTASRLTWLRPFYVYGPGQPSTTLWGQLHAAIARGDKVFPMSPGQQTRDYLPAEEMGRLIAEVAVRQPGPSPVLNVCSGTSSRILDMVRDWIAASGSDIREAPGALPYAQYEPMDAVGSRESLNQLLRSPL